MMLFWLWKFMFCKRDNWQIKKFTDSVLFMETGYYKLNLYVLEIYLLMVKIGKKF